MENIELLVKVFFFKDLGPAELVKIASIVRNESFPMGRKVFEAGTASDAFFIIKSGSLMVKKGALVLAAPGVGDPIGEMSFVDRGERSATVAAIEETELLKIPFAALDTLFDDEPQIAAKIYKAIATVLSQRLREMSETINTKFQPSKF
jgi:CRP/FNR family transcriptional regulator, cyclic AMP receptor protein